MHLVDDGTTGTRSPLGSSPALVDGFDASVDAVAHDIATIGSACLHDAVTDGWLRAAIDFVTNSVDLDGKHELFIENLAADPDTFAHQLLDDHRLEPFLRSVAQAGLPRLQSRGHQIENELRLVNGRPPTEKPLWFHYDGTAVTMVLPIIIPKSTPGRSGELILCPNRRPFRRSVIVNIAEKFLSQNDIYRRRFVKKLYRDRNVSTLALEPGNAYLFSGYRSYHATLPCPPNSLRVTLILHLGNVHQDSRTLAITRSVSRTVRQRIRAGGPTSVVTHR